MILQKNLKAGQTRCCEKRTAENSVSSNTYFKRTLIFLPQDNTIVDFILNTVFYSPRISVFFNVVCRFIPESSPAAEPLSKRVKMEEIFQLSEQQKQFIREDTANKKNWDEAMEYLTEGPVGIPVHSDHGNGMIPLSLQILNSNPN